MNRIVIAVLVVLLAAVGATAPLAQTVSTNVEGNNGGVVTSDPQGPSATIVSSALTFPFTFTVDLLIDGFGRAIQSPGGTGAVLADAAFANGEFGNYVEARATWTGSATNNTAGPVNYVFDFFITPPSLLIADFAGASETDTGAPDVFFDITISANSTMVFKAETHLIGGFVSHVLNETGTSLGPSFIGISGNVFGYNFQPYTDILDLGAVAPGGTMTVEYVMVVRVNTAGFEFGGRAQIGDPFDLDGNPGFSGTLSEGGVLPTESATWGKIKSLFR